MPKIQLLSKDTIDKIAAGEVIERSLNVVKELVENAIDSHSSAITVEIKDGGIDFIRVTDNGAGIEEDDVRNAFFRHATSKISGADDLASLHTLGFRGEALSSISAVSKTELMTKTAESLRGTRILMEGGEEVDFTEIGVPQGTTIVVRDLFYNVPARRKFLKTPSTEGSYILDMMENIALSAPQIAFTFISNGKTKFRTNGTDKLDEAIYRVLGKELSASLIPIHIKGQTVRISGFIGRPQTSYGNRSFEKFYVNDRFIKSELLSRAVEEGYRGFLMQHRFPFCVLKLSLPPEEIDINVHPAKMEIRFASQNHVFDDVTKAVRDALNELELIASVTFEAKNKSVQKTEKNGSTQTVKAPEPFEQNRKNIVDAQYMKILEPQNDYGTQKPVNPIIEEKSITEEKSIIKEKSATEKSSFTEMLKPNFSPQFKEIEQIKFENRAFLNETSRKKHNILGQIFDTYWLVTFEDKLYIIDQHAAHEKVIYERLLKRMKESAPAGQLLDPPIVQKLGARAKAAVMDHVEYFANLGFELEEFGGADIAIRSVPVEMMNVEPSHLLETMAYELESFDFQQTSEIICNQLAKTACKAAVKGQHRLSLAEMDTLIGDLLTLDNPYHCPHGRPTIVSMTKYEIEKKFKRIV